ncbi:hypothetical protein [Demequina litorisediminis]|uniref:hypothetical protein n=1 Tax=Demequina litorisediminis TaxID=1849022 RepID=UPI0024E17EFE|nr:hypothetical protein [Demequina litorisediminis]
MSDGDQIWAFGSHGASAYTADLVNWTQNSIDLSQSADNPLFEDVYTEPGGDLRVGADQHPLGRRCHRTTRRHVRDVLQRLQGRLATLGPRHRHLR